ncbi:uncharacterized protein AB675_1095 [Cyphellophora attinorum]|uniref:SnoaL-like domain-containing protein n=1 Tax=Cyphellophora attinorum TaxID=1664694 RepID=A0A0N0NKE5_9EURO|nr:uncharacterized protein AB675_1095 [Phialophora attinorum]KPI38051.1 hypothetical protein AB675_1095 [Phialophora attinorum]
MSYATAAEQLLSIRDKSVNEKLDYVLDYIAITDLVQRYGQATDTRDFRLLRSCYDRDIEVDHTPSIGGGLFRISADEWCRLADKFHSQLDGDEHIMILLSVVLSGDNTASCHVLMHASHYYRKANGSPYQTIAGTYDMEFRRTGAGWKIAKSVQKLHFAKGNWQFHEEIKNSLGNLGGA